MAAFLAIVLMVPGTKKTSSKGVSVGLASPDISLKAPDGGIWNLSDQKGKAVVVNFWATWCESCKAEMPALQKLFDTLKANPGFTLMTVLVRDSAQNASEYMKQKGYSLPFVVDDGSASSAYGITGVPETFIVDKNGVLREKIIGPADFDSAEALNYFGKLASE